MFGTHVRRHMLMMLQKLFGRNKGVCSYCYRTDGMVTTNVQSLTFIESQRFHRHLIDGRMILTLCYKPESTRVLPHRPTNRPPLERNSYVVDPRCAMFRIGILPVYPKF